jgi:hypothetical protein
MAAINFRPPRMRRLRNSINFHLSARSFAGRRFAVAARCSYSLISTTSRPVPSSSETLQNPVPRKPLPLTPMFLEVSGAQAAAEARPVIPIGQARHQSSSCSLRIDLVEVISAEFPIGHTVAQHLADGDRQLMRDCHNRLALGGFHRDIRDVQLLQPSPHPRQLSSERSVNLSQRLAAGAIGRHPTRHNRLLVYAARTQACPCRVGAEILESQNFHKNRLNPPNHLQPSAQNSAMSSF